MHIKIDEPKTQHTLADLKPGELAVDDWGKLYVGITSSHGVAISLHSLDAGVFWARALRITKLAPGTVVKLTA